MRQLSSVSMMTSKEAVALTRLRHAGNLQAEKVRSNLICCHAQASSPWPGEDLTHNKTA